MYASVVTSFEVYKFSELELYSIENNLYGHHTENPVKSIILQRINSCFILLFLYSHGLLRFHCILL